jgi:hypothetical protein
MVSSVNSLSHGGDGESKMSPPLITTLDREVKTTQQFSRRGVGYLWSRRAELDAGQTAIVDSIYKNRKKGSLEGQQVITYKLARSKAGQLGYGRLFGQKGSLETLKRECRGTICREYYHDIDVVNAHPVLLVQFAKSKYNRDLPELEHYNDHREEVLARISPNRDEAKEEVIKVLYGGRTTHEVLHPLYTEIRTFTKFLLNQQEFSDLATAVKDGDNVYGTFLSYVLQTYERAVMLAMKGSLEQSGWKVDVLAYDGVMIRRDTLLKLDESLRKAEADITTKTGFCVKLLDKQMDAFEIPHDKEEIVAGVLKEDYDRMKEEFERDHFYFVPTNQYAELDDGIVNFYDCDHAREYFKSKWRFKVSDKFNDFVEFFLLYRNDENRRTIKEIDYQAHPDDPHIFTPPLDFKYKITTASPNADCVDLFTTLLRINTGNDPVLYNYLLKYTAHMLQCPFDLAGVAIVITGNKGVGKDTLFDFLIEYVIGMKFAKNYESNQQFFEKHDVGRENKFLVKLEEADRKYCIDNASTLKSMITAQRSTFNPKGKKPYGTNNYARYIFTTNKPNPMDMSDEERRFVITACSSEKKGDFAFWTDIRTKLFTEEGGKAVADFLLGVDLTGFNVRLLPENAYQRQVIETELTPEDRFVADWDGVEADSSTLYNTYRSWCVENNQPYVGSSLVLGKRLLKYTRDGLIHTQRKGGNKNYYSKPNVPLGEGVLG